MTQEIQKYGSFDVALIDEMDKELKRGANDFYKFKPGENYVRFLPPPIGKHPFVIAHQHMVAPDGQAKMFVCVCPKRVGKPCPICNKNEELKATGNAKDYEIAERQYARARIYANVIDRDNEEAGPLILAFGKTVLEQLNSIRVGKDGGDFTHPVSGFDIIIDKRGGHGGSFKDIKYIVRPARNVTPLGNMQWIEQQADIWSRFMKILSWDEIVQQMGGLGHDVVIIPKAAPQLRKKSTIEDDLAAGDDVVYR